MKNCLQYFLLMAIVLLASSGAAAQDEPRDTVYFYDSWEGMMTMAPAAMLANPYIETVTPFEIYIEAADARYNEVINDRFIAATLGDSIWLINSEYLKRDFKGDAKKLHGFVPVFFNEKVAFASYAGIGNFKTSVMDFLFGVDGYETNDDFRLDYFYIDFVNRKVLKVTPEVLSGLLEDYHDLQMRYEGMRDYKKDHIIEDYFFKFIDRATSDFMKPYILDLMPADNGTIN